MEFLKSVEEFIGIVADISGISPTWVALLTGGTVIGVVVGIFGKIAFRFGVWGKQAAAADRPQSATTAKTPRQVVQESDAAQAKLLLGKLIIFIILVAVVLNWLGFLDDVLLLTQQIIGPIVAP